MTIVIRLSVTPLIVSKVVDINASSSRIDDVSRNVYDLVSQRKEFTSKTFFDRRNKQN